MVRLSVLFLCVAIAYSTVSHSHGLTDGDIEHAGQLFTQEAPGVFVRYGAHEEISKTTVQNIANHGFVVGEKSVAIIDPGGSLAIANGTLDAIRSHTNLPVSHVLITHVHPDHSIGLAAYSTMSDVIFLGHPALTDALYTNLEFFNDNYFQQQEHKIIEDMLNKDKLKPVSNEDTIDLGNRLLTLHTFNRAHSNTDVAVFDNTEKMLWAGDLVFADRLPALDGSLTGWLSALETLENQDISTVIPGHGQSGSWQKLTPPQRKYLTQLLVKTRHAIANNISLKSYINAPIDKTTRDQTPHKQWLLLENQHRINQTRAYTELEWE